jgi:cytochrome oxidase Cu insertion factor (SCO1/SenC/PrrC family)
MVQRQLFESLQPLIRNPEMIFILKASALIVDSLRKKVTGTFDPQDDDARKAFLKKYEYAVFTRSPWRTREFKQQIAEIFLRSFSLKPVAVQ